MGPAGRVDCYARAMRQDQLETLPPDLPVPIDDGLCDHLPGMAVPPVALDATDGSRVRLDLADPAGAPRTVVFAYPRTGRPDEEPPGGLTAWNAIPGARGCTPQACAYRDRHAALAAAGARVFGLSTQDTDYQREMAQRLHLPFPVLSDDGLELTHALGLPTFQTEGLTLHKRHTLTVRDGPSSTSCTRSSPPTRTRTRSSAGWPPIPRDRPDRPPVGARSDRTAAGDDPASRRGAVFAALIFAPSSAWPWR